MQLQIARRLTMVGSRWSWVASGGAVLLGNGMQNARSLITVVLRWSWVASGCAVFLRNATADC